MDSKLDVLILLSIIGHFMLSKKEYQIIFDPVPPALTHW